MTQFILSALKEASPPFREAVRQKVAPADQIQLDDHVWLIAFNGTAKELATALGIADGSLGKYIITSMASVNGFVPQEVIQWIDEHERRH